MAKQNFLVQLVEFMNCDYTHTSILTEPMTISLRLTVKNTHWRCPMLLKICGLKVKVKTCPNMGQLQSGNHYQDG